LSVVTVFLRLARRTAADIVTLRRRLDREFGWPATVPRPNQLFSL